MNPLILWSGLKSRYLFVWVVSCQVEEIKSVLSDSTNEAVHKYNPVADTSRYNTRGNSQEVGYCRDDLEIMRSESIL